NYHELLGMLSPIEIKELREGKVSQAVKKLSERSEEFLEIYDEDRNREIDLDELIKERWKLAQDLDEGIVQTVKDLEREIVNYRKTSQYRTKDKTIGQVKEEIEQQLENQLTNQGETIPHLTPIPKNPCQKIKEESCCKKEQRDKGKGVVREVEQTALIEVPPKKFISDASLAKVLFGVNILIKVVIIAIVATFVGTSFVTS
ncbi:7983_t:CDS:2, partial [Gigaspora margarita]